MRYKLYVIVSVPSEEYWLKRKGPRFYDNRERLASGSITGENDLAELFLTREAAEEKAAIMNTNNIEYEIVYEVQAIELRLVEE